MTAIEATRSAKIFKIHLDNLGLQSECVYYFNKSSLFRQRPDTVSVVAPPRHAKVI